jgi:murein DD-endopeptidase MepM/ murein hydrolase activator NlpD
VWACTYSGSIAEKGGPGAGYGRVMMIKSLTEDKLYFLAHLDAYYKKVGDIVWPLDDVAVCGNTGYSTGPHLHVEVRLCTETDKDNVLSRDANKKHTKDDRENGGAGLDWMPDYRPGGPARVNPFDHTEVFVDKR